MLVVSLLHLSAGHWRVWAGGAEESWNSVGVARATLPLALAFGVRRWWLGLCDRVSARAAGWVTLVSPSQVKSRLSLGWSRLTVPLLQDLAELRSTVGLTFECSGSLSPLACVSEATQLVG